MLLFLGVNVSSPETSYCLYQGLYLGEKWNYRHATIDEICSEYKTSSETSMTSYYTRGKSLYIALYWYKNYSFITATVSLNVTKCKAVYLNICEYHHYCTGNFSSDDFKAYMSNIARKTSLKFGDCDGFLKTLTFEFKSRECVILVLFDEFDLLETLDSYELFNTCNFTLSSTWGENKIPYIDGFLGDGNYLEVVGHKNCFSSKHPMCNTIFKDRSGSEFHQKLFTKNFKQYLSEDIDVVLVKINSRQTKNLVNIMLIGLNGTRERKQYGLTAHQPGLKMSDLMFCVALSTTWSLGLDWILSIDKNITIGSQHRNTLCHFTLERKVDLILSAYGKLYSSFLEIKWRMSLDLLSLQQRQYISIRGEHKNFEINCEGFIPPEMSHIYVTSLLEKKSDGFKNEDLKFCHYHGNVHQKHYMYCRQFSKNNVEYLIFGNVSNFYPHKYIDKKIYYSWLNANTFCKRMGYELPYFMSRDELDDLIALLHGSGYIPLLEAIFVGLLYIEHKVNLCYII